MDKITIYEKPTCTTCRKLSNLLIEKGVDFTKVLARPPEKVNELFKK